MRLTQVVFKYRPEWIGWIPKFPGKVDIGKHRYVPAITKWAKLRKLEELVEEERVMKTLSKSYLSEAEERALLHDQKRIVPEMFDDYLFHDLRQPPQQKYAAEFLKPLDKSRRFEEMD